MPVGWRAAFGEELCKEIMEELVRNNCVDSYQVLQIKEKYGELRWYSQGGTERIHREIVPKYEKMSRRICIQCGQPATLVSKSWVAPWCVDCASKMPHMDFVDADEFFGIDRDD
jgi:thiol-disulfide isomerase/thioredoxin